MPTAKDNWTVAQLQATVAAYATMSALVGEGTRVVKKHVYVALSSQHGRRFTAYQRRFCNISYVLTTMGLRHIPGIGSHAHVGAVAEKVIRQAILDTPYFWNTVPVEVAGGEVEQQVQVPAGNKQPPMREVVVTRVERDPAIVNWVLAIAAGHCENCGLPAPFLREDGTPYLEVHHVKWLAQKGSDTVTNAVALCPNCHRRFHYGGDAAALLEQLFARVARLQPE